MNSTEKNKTSIFINQQRTLFCPFKQQYKKTTKKYYTLFGAGIQTRNLSKTSLLQ